MFPDWTSTNLGNLLSLEYGKPLAEEERTGYGFPVFGSNGIVGWHERSLIGGPGVIVGRKGSVGDVAWSKDSFWPIDTAYYVKCKREFDWRWSYWLLRSLNLKRLDSSTGVPGLNRNDVYGIALKIPDPSEQRLIGRDLDIVDDAIRQTGAVIEKLKKIRAGLLHDLLTRGIDENGELRDPVRNPQMFKDSPLGLMPKSWDVAELRTVASVQRGKFMYRPRNDPRLYGGPYPFVQTGDVAACQGGILESWSQTLNEKGRKVSQEFQSGTIAVTIAANIGDTAILGLPMCFPDSVVGLVVQGGNVNSYIQLCIEKRKKSLEAQAPQSAQKNINLEILRPLLLPMALPDEQGRITKIWKLHNARISSEVALLRKLQLLKQGLAEDLLTGRVRVPTQKKGAKHG